jgi:hypothetical protein
LEGGLFVRYVNQDRPGGDNVHRPILERRKIIGRRLHKAAPINHTEIRRGLPTEGEQASLVARAERLEGGVVALPGQRDQALVGLQAQQR